MSNVSTNGEVSINLIRMHIFNPLHIPRQPLSYKNRVLRALDNGTLPKKSVYCNQCLVCNKSELVCIQTNCRTIKIRYTAISMYVENRTLWGSINS